MSGLRKTDNLKSNAARTAAELRSNGAKGGKASGEARRRKKATQDLVKMVLAMDVVTSRKTKNALKKLGYDVDKEGAPSVELLMQIAIANQAMAGDLASARFLYDYAQIPDIKTALERERIQATVESRARVDLNLNPADGDAILSEIRQRMEGEAPALQGETARDLPETEAGAPQ